MTVAAQFQDRREAGQVLAAKLEHFAGDPSALVLALPPDGVPVAYEVAKALDAPLDVFVVEKLFAPGFEELTMGVVASGGVRILNQEVVRRLNISKNLVATLVQEREQELRLRERMYRGECEPVPMEGKRVLLVNDGIDIGTAMHNAVQALRAKKPKSVTVTVPIASADTCRQIERETDGVVCLMSPEPLFSVGAWYADFIQITDEEVHRLLAQLADERRVRQVQTNGPTREDHIQSFD